MPERVHLKVEDPAVLWRRIGGLTVLERQLFSAARAGVKTVRIDQPLPAPTRLRGLRFPTGLELRWEPGPCSKDWVSRPADRFARGDDSISIDDPHVIDWLMAAGSKSQDGFMARHFDRHLSGAISRLLLNTRVTPNMMTILSVILGLIGASLFLGASRTVYISGALLIWLHSTLDGCDGELARVRYQESAFGSDLDFWGDNLVHLALFTCLGIGFWKTGNGAHTLVLAGVADGGVIASAWAAWKHRLERRRAHGSEAGVIDEISGDGVESRLSRLENALAQRDFIYLLVFLAFVDCVYEFLWAAAIGSLLYFGIILYLRRVNGYEHARQPHPAR